MRTRAVLFMMMSTAAVVACSVCVCAGDEKTDKLVEEIVAQAKTNPERAAKLYKAADAMRDEAIKAGLFEKTVEYGLKVAQDANTRPLVEKALAILPGLDPNKAGVYSAQRVELYHAWLLSAKPEEKADVGYKYADALLAVARGHEDARRWKEALAAYQTTAGAAQSAKVPSLIAEAREGANRVGEMDTASKQVDSLAKTLEKDPSDARTRLALVEALVVALDDPNGAIRHVNEDLPEAWRTYLPLAAGGGDANDRGVCKEVGDWYYKVLLPKAQPFAKLNMEARAEDWYHRVLAAGGEDELAVRTRLALEQIEEAQAKRSGVPKDYITSFIAKRDALPVAKQVELIEQALSELSRGAKAKVFRHEADTAGKRLIGLELNGPDLLTLEPLTGLPLERLVIGGYPTYSCPKIRDLRGLQGMPLKSLYLDAPAMRSLRGLRGLKLESLTLVGWKNLATLEGLEGMPLKNLELLKCNELKDLQPLRGLPLEKLTIKEAAKLESLKGLDESPLASLDLSECPLLTSLDGLNAKKLTKLSLSKCGVKSLAGLEDAPLIDLSLAASQTITTLAPLKGNKTITKLFIWGCYKLISLEGVETMPLTQATVAGCWVPEAEMDRLKKIPTLKEVKR